MIKPVHHQNTPQPVVFYLSAVAVTHSTSKFCFTTVDLVGKTMNDPSSRQMERTNEGAAHNVAQLLSVTLGGRLPALDPESINRNTEQIQFLKRELEEKNEAISRLNKDMKEVRKQNGDLKITVDLKNKEIKVLKDKIDKLQSEKKALETKLRAVEVELEAVRGEVVELKEANKISEDKNIIMEENVERLSKKMEGIEYSLDEARNENTNLEKKIQTLEDAVQRKTSTERMALPFDPSEVPSLVLGELCTRIQAMMYQKVHPNSYEEAKSYTYRVKHIEEDIEDIQDEQLKDEAKQRYDELKKKLKWEKRRHVRAMKSLQMSRNVTAHPVLNEESIALSAEMMKKAGKLTGWHNPACIEEFIAMWKTLQHI